MSSASLDGWRSADAPPGARTAHESWRGALSFDVAEGALSFGGRDELPEQGGLGRFWQSGRLPLVSLADGGVQRGASALYAGWNLLGVAIDVGVRGRQRRASRLAELIRDCPR